jgi:hypothetical protein
MDRILRPLARALGLLLLAAPAAARSGEDPCPWCEEGEPATLGVVGHGPMPLLGADSAAFRAAYEESEWLLLETTHFRIVSDLGASRLSAKDAKRIEADLERLRAAFPDLPKRVTKLDPWLRLHWIGLRLEDFYARFQGLLGVTDADFPESRGAGPFMGDGRYLGEKEKFEVYLHQSRGTHQRLTGENNGVRVEGSMRWHSRAPHKLIVSVPAHDADLRQDRWLLPHLAHNLSHAFLAAYKHFSYDPPVWLDEGLAHAMEREIEPDSWTREGEEGTFQDGGRSKPWDDAARKLARDPDSPSLSSLLAKHTIGELARDEHVVCWAAVRFLIDHHGEAFAAFLGGVKGQLDARGYPSGKDLPALQRRLLRELWDWSPPDLDAAWRAAATGEAGDGR